VDMNEAVPTVTIFESDQQMFGQIKDGFSHV
jgi:hypothetical protein